MKTEGMQNQVMGTLIDVKLSLVVDRCSGGKKASNGRQNIPDQEWRGKRFINVNQPFIHFIRDGLM